MALKQEVFLEVWDAKEGGNLVLDASGLRVDFDIRHIPGFSRASFIIYNLNEQTIQSLMNPGLYVTLKTQLHGGVVSILADRFYVNNAHDELTLPYRVTTLLCFDNLKLSYLETPVTLSVLPTPSLQDMISSLLWEIGYGSTESTDFKSFPKGLLEENSKLQTRVLNGSARDCLAKLEAEFNFTTYTVNGRFLFMYKPDLKNVNSTSLVGKAPDVILTTNSMRSNPKIGIATCTIHSNLNGAITPTSVLDLSQLLTVGTDSREQTLQLVDGYLKNFSSFSKYQAFAVTHTGSNYTADWSTRITGLSPTKGKLMPTVAWASRDYK